MKEMCSERLHADEDMEADIQKLQERMHYQFKEPMLLHRALSHSSYINERQNEYQSNERLEFLGDSVLGFITAEYYYSQFKAYPEGDLTKLRAATVCEKSLFGFAQELGLGEYLLLGKGEVCTGGRERPSILADAFEAVIAAVYLDGGMEEARRFVLSYVKKAEDTPDPFRDYKTKLQEIIQKNPEENVEYVHVGETGPDHDKRFTVEVHLNSNVIGRGVGKSKKLAEQEAAHEALTLMGIKL